MTLTNIGTFADCGRQFWQVFPAVATGFSDSNAYLRELTLKSMLVLAPKLSQRTINQVLLKHLAKLQVWPPPNDKLSSA